MEIILLQTVGGVSGEGQAGGGVVNAIALAKEWQKLGHEVHYFSNTYDLTSAAYSGLANVHRLPSLGLVDSVRPIGPTVESVANFWVQWKVLAQAFGKCLRDPQNTVIVCTTPAPSDLLAAFRLSRRHNIRVVVFFHHIAPPPWWFPEKRGGILRSSFLWVLSFGALAVTKIGGFLPSLDQPGDLLSSSWRFDSGVLEHDLFLPTSPPSHPAPRPRTTDACFVSRIAENKGVLDLIRAWAKVINRQPAAKLSVAGTFVSEAFQHRVVRMAKDLGLEGRVTFMGFLSQTQKEALLQSSKLFILPSYEEGWSLSVMEAALNGALPVVYDLSAYSYLGNTCSKVRPGDWAALSDAIIELLSNDSRRAEMAAQAEVKVRCVMADFRPRRFIQGIDWFRRYGKLSGWPDSPPTADTSDLSGVDS